MLAWALQRELERFEDDFAADLSTFTDPFVNLGVVASALVDAMEASGPVAEALMHAYAVSHVVASAEAEMIRVQTREMFIRVISGDVTTDLHSHIADLLIDVWTAEVLALVQGRRTYPGVRRRLATVIDVIARTSRVQPQTSRATE